MVVLAHTRMIQIAVIRPVRIGPKRRFLGSIPASMTLISLIMPRSVHQGVASILNLMLICFSYLCGDILSNMPVSEDQGECCNLVTLPVYARALANDGIRKLHEEPSHSKTFVDYDGIFGKFSRV